MDGIKKQQQQKNDCSHTTACSISRAVHALSPTSFHAFVLCVLLIFLLYKPSLLKQFMKKLSKK